MLKFLLIAGSLSVLASIAEAQALPSAPSPIAPAATVPDSIPTRLGRWYLPQYVPSATVADTTGALVCLFAQKRNNTWWWLPLAPLGLAAVQPGEESVNGVRTRSIPPDTWQYAVGIPLMLGGVGGMIARLSTYSRAGLQQIEEDYQAGKPIPARLRRKLKPVHFANAAVMRVVLVQQLQMNKLREQQRAARRN